MTNIEECNIDVTLKNGQKLKCDLKFTVNMKLQVGETVKSSEVLYVSQAVKNILSVSRIISKGATMGYTKDKITINKGILNINLDAIKVKN